MKFKLGFECLEGRENPDATGGAIYSVPPVDPITVPPAPIVDPGLAPGGTSGPVVPPIPPFVPF